MQEINHPMMKFKVGYKNDSHGWAKILNMSYSDFYYHLDKGDFKNWLKQTA